MPTEWQVSARFSNTHFIYPPVLGWVHNRPLLNRRALRVAATGLVLATVLYPQISLAADGKQRDPGCNVPRGYDCATPGYERPVALDEAIEISKVETVVYLYGKGIQSVDTAAHIMRSNTETRSIPAVAVPGKEMPHGVFHVIVLGQVVRHKASGEPAEFFQRFINRGTVFVLTRQMYDKAIEAR